MESQVDVCSDKGVVEAIEGSLVIRASREVAIESFRIVEFPADESGFSIRFDPAKLLPIIHTDNSGDSKFITTFYSLHGIIDSVTIFNPTDRTIIILKGDPLGWVNFAPSVNPSFVFDE